MSFSQSASPAPIQPLCMASRRNASNLDRLRRSSGTTAASRGPFPLRLQTPDGTGTPGFWFSDLDREFPVLLGGGVSVVDIRSGGGDPDMAPCPTGDHSRLNLTATPHRFMTRCGVASRTMTPSRMSFVRAALTVRSSSSSVSAIQDALQSPLALHSPAR